MNKTISFSRITRLFNGFVAMKSLKINTKLQLLNRQNESQNPKLRRLLCNSLIQPHFDYACCVWYPVVS